MNENAKKPAKNDDNYTIHCKLSKAEYEVIKEKAEKDYRSINNLIYKMLKDTGVI